MSGAAEAQVVIDGLHVQNSGWRWRPLDDGKARADSPSAVLHVRNRLVEPRVVKGGKGRVMF